MVITCQSEKLPFPGHNRNIVRLIQSFRKGSINPSPFLTKQNLGLTQKRCWNFSSLCSRTLILKFAVIMFPIILNIVRFVLSGSGIFPLCLKKFRSIQICWIVIWMMDSTNFCMRFGVLGGKFLNRNCTRLIDPLKMIFIRGVTLFQMVSACLHLKKRCHISSISSFPSVMHIISQ